MMKRYYRVKHVITKWNGYVIIKYDKSSLQNVSDSLSQNATVLLQIVTVTRKCINFITKCVPLLPNESVHISLRF